MKKPPIYLVASEVWQKGHCNLPFGIMFVGRALKDAGWDVRLFHLHQGEEGVLFDAVRQDPPLFVGVSTIVGPTLARDIGISRSLKAMGQVVVWGGVFASMVPEMVMDSGVADFVVKGEAERSCPQLAEAIFEKAAPKNIPGVGWRDQAQVLINKGCEWPRDLDQFQPGWELIDLKKYFRKFPGRDEYFWQVLFSRGCPWSCAFCYNRLDEERKQWRANSLEYWKEQLVHLEKNLPAKISVLALAGDNAFGDPERAWNLVSGLGKKWSAVTRIELVSGEFVKRAKDTGAVYLGFGMESGSDRMLKIYNKGIDSAQAMVAAEKLAALKCLIDFGVMFFGPGETNEDRRLTVEFMEQARAKNPYLFFAFNVFRPFPSTPLWENALAQGWKSPQSLEEWASEFDSFMEAHEWTREKWQRLAAVLKILYEYPRAAGEPISLFARKILYRRLHNFSFNYPLEEVLRFIYRNYRQLRNKPVESYAIDRE